MFVGGGKRKSNGQRYNKGLIFEKRKKNERNSPSIFQNNCVVMLFLATKENAFQCIER